jgi:hypothetical protein
VWHTGLMTVLWLWSVGMWCLVCRTCTIISMEHVATTSRHKRGRQWACLWNSSTEWQCHFTADHSHYPIKFKVNKHCYWNAQLIFMIWGRQDPPILWNWWPYIKVVTEIGNWITYTSTTLNEHMIDKINANKTYASFTPYVTQHELTTQMVLLNGR